MNAVQIVSKIREAFSQGVPNGFLLDWDRERFYSSLVREFKGCRVINDTDFNYSFCNTYELDGLGSSKEDYVITIKISFVADAYTVYVTKYWDSRRKGKVVPDELVPEIGCSVSDVKIFFKKMGFEEVDGEMMDVEIPDVQLELAETATIGKCLFDDFE